MRIQYVALRAPTAAGKIARAAENEPVNLLYFTTAYESGIFGNRIHEEFLENLLDAGHVASVLTPDAQARGAARLRVESGPPSVTRAAVSASRGQRLANRVSRSATHYDYFLTARAAYRAYLRAHPELDVIHVESVYPLAAVAATAGAGPPFIATIRGGDLIADDSISYGFARFRSTRLLLRLTFVRAALVRAVSPGARQMALRYGCPPEKIMIVPRNIRANLFVEDLPTFRAERRRLIDERYGTAGRPLIVAAGRLLPVKGFDDLIRAMPQLLSAIPAAKVLICGPNRIDPQFGDYAAYLDQLMLECGVAESVTLVGHVAPEQMADYLAAADAVAVPSLIEGGNKILVEGAALGTPFVATETSGTVGFYDASQAISIPVRDPARLAAGLTELLADREAWERRSAACVAGRLRFHPNAVAASMEQLYQQIIDRRALAARPRPA